MFIILLRVLFAAAATAVVMYVVHTTVKYTRMIGSIFSSLVYRPEGEAPKPTTGEVVTVLDSGGAEIQVLSIESRGSKKAVIFCHESGSSKESWEKYAYFLPRAGFHVLSLDFAGEADGRPQSVAQWPTAEDVARLLTVIRWAKKALGPDLEVVLFGVSNGADIAFAASFEDVAVRAVIADGLFSMKEIFRDYIRRWAPVLVRPNFFGEKYPTWIVDFFARLGFRYCQKKSGTRFVDIDKLLKRKHKPILMIHGALDEYVPRSHQDFLARRAKARPFVRTLVVEEAGHNKAVATARSEYERTVIEFLLANVR